MLARLSEADQPAFRQFLVAIKADAANSGGVVRNGKGTIDVPHYAGLLGVSEYFLRKTLGERLSELNQKFAESESPQDAIRRRCLERIDADRESASGIATTPSRVIDIPHYAACLDVSVSALRKALGSELSSLNADLSRSGHLRTPLERRVLAEIERDVTETGRPRFGRGGKIFRQHYAKLVGVSHHHLGNSCRSLLNEMDREYGGPSNAEVRLPEMRRWLEDRYQRRDLTFRDGKLDRKGFQLAFNLSQDSGLMAHYPGIRALFAEFDHRAAVEEYVPAALNEELERLRAALDDAPELNRDHLTVNRVAMSHRVGIKLSRLKNGQFADEIRRHERKLLDLAERSETDPFLAGRVFRFSDLADVWCAPFVARIGAQFKAGFSFATDTNQVQACYLAMRRLLIWIGKSTEPVCRSVVSTGFSGGPLVLDEWDRAVRAYRDDLVAEVQRGVRTKSSADREIGGIRRVLARMHPLLPELDTHLPGLKFARAFVAHRPSLAEARSDARPSATYLEFANDMLRQAADRYRIGIGQEEADAFTHAIADELGQLNDVPADPAHAILLILNRRLAAIHEAASAIMENAKADLAHGRELRLKADINAADFRADLLRNEKQSMAMRRVVRRWFPNPLRLRGKEAEAARERSVSNLLKFSHDEFEGILPTGSRGASGKFDSFFFRARFLELGGMTSLVPLLAPSSDACGAALTLYLVESGANLSVGRTLDADCVEPTNEKGFKLVTGHKARAKGKPIFAELPSDSAALRALEWYVENSAPYRANSSGQDRNSLFVVRIGERCQIAPPTWYTSWFRAFAKSIPSLADAYVVPSMIRPSVLLKAALENDGRLQIGRAIGQHGQAVTRGYQEKLPVRLLRDQHMRRFLRQFETRVLQDVSEIAQSLGISSDEFERRLQEMQATGLGTFCADPYSRPGFEGKRCSSVDCWRDCPQMLIVANVDSVALLQIWKASLEQARGDWERDHPERWGEVWLPWLCLTEIVEKRMSRGRLLLTWKLAQKRAAELSVSPGFVAPRPF